MNNTFNFNRFAMVLKKDAQDLASQYIKLVLIVAGAFLVAFLLLAIGNPDNFSGYNDARKVIAAMFIWGGTVLAPLQLYKRHNSRLHGTGYFMLPASQLEKWLSMLLHCAAVTPIVLLSSIIIIDMFMYPIYIWENKTLLLTSYDWHETHYAVISILASQAVFFLGNIWFQRAKVQKIVGALSVLFVMYIILMIILSSITALRGTHNYAMHFIFMNTPSYSVLQTVISCIIAPTGIWAVSFIRMKEQQL
ncbi:MAG: hypothetical protein LBV26_08805 [Bacteroidales bacterium]|jgi:hypothetical protein|nr:hypothetical protein [Bacteroidales bacterium]